MCQVLQIEINSTYRLKLKLISYNLVLSVSNTVTNKTVLYRLQISHLKHGDTGNITSLVPRVYVFRKVGNRTVDL